MSHCQTASPLFLFFGSSPTSSSRYLVFFMPTDITVGESSELSFPVDLPHQCLVMSELARHSVTHNNQPTTGSQTGLRLRALTPARLPAANSPFLSHFPDPVSSPDRSSIAISVSRFRYCRSWVICLMPSGPSWGRQSVYATWLETSSRAWTASSLNPIIIALAGGVGFKTPFFPHMP